MSNSQKFTMARQGDVLIRRVDSKPEGVSAISRDGNRVILAYGEVTGHAHAIEEPAVQHWTLTPDAEESGRNKAWLEVSEVPAWLYHEEHNKIELPPGTYEITRQREYAEDRTRFVAD